jgi:hypothetical protein
MPTDPDVRNFLDFIEGPKSEPSPEKDKPRFKSLMDYWAEAQSSTSELEKENAGKPKFDWKAFWSITPDKYHGGN